VETHLCPEKQYWLDFPAVRATLTRWGILPEDARRDEVAKTGLRIRKILKSGADPLETMMRHFRRFPPDLIVLATHQRDSIERWLHKAVAEPLGRRSGAMTLFVPRNSRGFISMKDGAVGLKKILVPIDHHPDPQTVSKALLLARGLGCIGGEFRLVHVGSPRKAPVANPPHWPGWSYGIAVRRGNVVEEILKTEHDWHPDLMVLATHGHRDFVDALREHYGTSLARREMSGARCPRRTRCALAQIRYRQRCFRSP